MHVFLLLTQKLWKYFVSPSKSQPFCNQNTTEMQPKASQNTTKSQPKCIHFSNMRSKVYALNFNWVPPAQNKSRKGKHIDKIPLHSKSNNPSPVRWRNKLRINVMSSLRSVCFNGSGIGRIDPRLRKFLLALLSLLSSFGFSCLWLAEQIRRILGGTHFTVTLCVPLCVPPRSGRKLRKSGKKGENRIRNFSTLNKTLQSAREW